MKVLIIDDSPHRHAEFDGLYEGEQVDHALNYQQAIDCLNDTTYDVIQFDHDLGCTDGKGNELSGATIARYMAENGMKCRIAIVHSHNRSGAENILSILKSGDVSENCSYHPF